MTEIPEPEGLEAEINRIWEEIFGHTYTECRQLAMMVGPIGNEHLAHINSVSKYISKDQQPPGEDVV